MIANINWSDIYDCVDTQSAYYYLHATIRSNFDKCFPKETKKQNTYKDRLPWLTNELKQQIKKKNRLYVHSKRNPTQLNIEKYNNFKRALNKNLSMTKRQYYNELLDENKFNMKKFWSIIKEIINKKNAKPHPSYFNYEDRKITNSTEIANNFNEFFCKYWE